MSTVAFLLMCFATGCFIAHRTAKKEGNTKAQSVWSTLAIISVFTAIVLYIIIAISK